MSLLQCVVGLGLLSITSLLPTITILPLISQCSLRVEFPGSCFNCYSPQNTSISSYSVRIHHYSVISEQQGVHGAGYWEVPCWKPGDEPPLCASVGLKRAVLTGILQCRCFHSVWRPLSLEEGREGCGVGAWVQSDHLCPQGQFSRLPWHGRDLHPPAPS